MAGKTSYKTLLLKARELRSEAGKNAYQRAKLLTAVFDDRDFRASIGSLDDFEAADKLNVEVEDLCLTFLELREVLKAFPNESEWADGRLRTLYAETIKRAKANAVAATKEPTTRRTVTLKDLEAVKEEKREAEIALRRAEKEVAATVATVDQLKARVKELEIENAGLRGRIEQLERTMAVAR